MLFKDYIETPPLKNIQLVFFFAINYKSVKGDLIFLTSHKHDPGICTQYASTRITRYSIGYHLCDFSCHIYLSKLVKTISCPIMAAPLTSKLLVSDFASSVRHIPLTYVRPISDRPQLSLVENSGDTIPLIDLRDLYGPNRTKIIRQISHACSTYGFFQVTPVYCFCFKFTRISCTLLCFIAKHYALLRCFFFLLDQNLSSLFYKKKKKIIISSHV